MPFQRPTRRQFLAGLGVGGIAAVAGCSSSRSPPATASLDWSPDEWPVAHGTPTNTGYARSKTTPRTNPNIDEWDLWDVETWQVTDHSIQYGTVSSPVVVNGTLFVATGLPGGYGTNDDGILLAIDVATRRIQWHAKLSGGGSGTPAVADGLVIVGSNDRSLTAFDAASGSVRWRTTASAPVGTPSVAGGSVYVGDRHGSVHAFRRTDGKLQWRYGQRTLDSVGSFFSNETWQIHAKPAVTDDTVYVTTGIGQHGNASVDRANLLALSRDDGSERWQYEYSGGGYTYRLPRAPVVADGTVFVSDSALHALDASDGTKQWQFAFGTLRMVSAPAVHDGTVYIGAKNVYALSATDGTEQWRFVNHAPVSGMTGHRVPMVSAPAVTDDTVYIGAGALDSSSGEKLWGDLGNQEDSDYFVSAGNQNAVVEGPAVAEDAVYLGMQYGSVLRVTEGNK